MKKPLVFIVLAWAVLGSSGCCPLACLLDGKKPDQKALSTDGGAKGKNPAGTVDKSVKKSQ